MSESCFQIFEQDTGDYWKMNEMKWNKHLTFPASIVGKFSLIIFRRVIALIVRWYDEQ